MTKILGIGLIACFLLFFQKYIYRKLWNRSLGITLRFVRSALFEGERGELLEVVENRKRLPLPVLKVKFQTSRNLDFGSGEGSRTTDLYYRNDVFQIGGGQRITRTLEFTAIRRGYYKINGIDLVAEDLFMTGEMTESRGTEEYLYVYPKPFDSGELRHYLQQLNGEVLSRRHLLEDPFEYRGIREYQPYDDMRSINWKATAKTGDFKVNQKNYTALKNVRIFFNIEDRGILKKEECVEASLRITAGLAEFFLSQGILVACYGNGLDAVDGSPVLIEPSAGGGQMAAIYRALARVKPEEAADFAACFREKLLTEGSGAITLFVAPNAYEPFSRLVAQCRAAGQECVWFYPVWDNIQDCPAGLEDIVRFIPVRG